MGLLLGLGAMACSGGGRVATPPLADIAVTSPRAPAQPPAATPAAAPLPRLRRVPAVPAAPAPTVPAKSPLIGPTPTPEPGRQPTVPGGPALAAPITVTVTPTPPLTGPPVVAAAPAPTAPAQTLVPPVALPSTLPAQPAGPAAPDATPTAAPAPVAAPLTKMDVERAFPNLSFRRMVALAYPEDGTNLLFLALQPGRIMVFRNDQSVTSASLFLDITERVNDRGNEEGLLGLAFDPDYQRNGYLYLYYSASSPRRSVVSRFSVSRDNPEAADPRSERVILEVPQPYANHNGGQLIFGPDGYLYIGLGDGGKAGDPHENGQNTSTLLASILRVDVSSIDLEGTYTIPPDNPFVGRGGGVREEIWAYGLRNPWRFTFDRLTGDVWAADVGQDRFEEVDIIRPGLNYGWNVMEGLHCFPRPEGRCDQRGLEMPVVEYTRGDGCSVTGGYVYRGSRLPSLYGAYVYGDFCSGKIWGLRHDGTRLTEQLELVDSRLQISSFGEDRTGELFILSFDGKIYRLKPP